MKTIAPNTTRIDVEFQGKPNYIAACLLEGEGGPALIDPGPSSSLGQLRSKLAARGLSVADLGALLLTHIHLDHAGATGTLVRENPRLRVFVHQRGAPHLIDPTRLLESATRLYGADMERLWGKVLPVPADNLRILNGGEREKVAGRNLEVAYTPGHASHHVSYLDTATGIAFVGDTAGIRIANQPCVLPVTPPPDIRLEQWSTSLEQIRAWRPDRLFVTHFGPATGVSDHLAEFQDRLQRWSQVVRESLQTDDDDAERARRFAQQVATELKTRMSEDEAAQYAQGMSPELCWYGLARYWRKRAER